MCHPVSVVCCMSNLRDVLIPYPFYPQAKLACTMAWYSNLTHVEWVVNELGFMDQLLEQQQHWVEWNK
jgi:D-serine deaminase-like pyridoxal phosphate-dependent protein